MLKQTGSTVLELLIGLGIMSGVSLYTMKMTEEVETAVKTYQDSAQHIQAIKKNIKHQQLQAINVEAILEADGEFAAMDEGFN